MRRLAFFISEDLGHWVEGLEGAARDPRGRDHPARTGGLPGREGSVTAGQTEDDPKAAKAKTVIEERDARVC